MDKRFNDTIRECEYCSKVIGTKFNEPFAMIKKDHADFKNSTKLWICKKVYEEGK